MSNFEIHIPARKKPTIAEKDAAVKVTGEAYNVLTEIYNEKKKNSAIFFKFIDCHDHTVIFCF